MTNSCSLLQRGFFTAFAVDDAAAENAQIAHGQSQPPGAVEIVPEYAVDQPAHVAAPEPARQLPVKALRRPLGPAGQLRPYAPVAPDGEAQQEDHAQREAHQAVRVEDVQIEIVRMADGDGIPLRDQPQRSESGIVLPRPGAEDRMPAEDRPAQTPQAPAPVARHHGKPQAGLLPHHEACRQDQQREQQTPGDRRARDGPPEHERGPHSQEGAAAAGPFQQEEGREKQHGQQQ